MDFVGPLGPVGPAERLEPVERLDLLEPSGLLGPPDLLGLSDLSGRMCGACRTNAARAYRHGDGSQQDAIEAGAFG